MAQHDCNKERELDILLKRTENIENKVLELLEFKWKIVAVVSTISIITSAGFTIVLQVWDKIKS
jgi:hypothetical protein